MWQKTRWVFPVIFAGILIFKICGPASVHKPPPLPRTLPDPNTDAPVAAAIGRPTLEAVDDDKAAKPQPADATPESPRNHLPVALLATAVGLTVGYVALRRVSLR